MPQDGRPVDPETRARVVQLFAEGNLGRNAIAREVKLAGSTISRIATEEGHLFDRSQSELATRVRHLEIAEIRADLAKAALLEAWDALEGMKSPTLMIQWASATEHQDGGFQEHLLDEPTISDKRNLATTFGILVSRAADLTRTVDASGSAEAASFLGDLSHALKVASDALSADPASDPTLEPTSTSREALLAEFEAQNAAAAEESDV